MLDTMTHFTFAAWTVPIATFFIALSVLSLVLRSKLAHSVLDIPNHRSLHSSPKPRIGGLGIAASLLTATTLILWLFPEQRNFPSSWLLPIVTAYAILLFISWRDDVKSLTAGKRLLAHLSISATWLAFHLPTFLTSYGLGLSLSLAALAVVTLGLTWAMNLFNFMDGSDGIAGVMATVGLAAYAVASYVNNDIALAVFCLSMATACLAFLCFNWPPAKLFLGDSGSIPLGFFLAAIGILGVVKQYWSALFPLLVFTLFWVDATATLAKRAVQGKKLSESHREHWYQKAIQSGLTHRQTLQIHLMCNILFSCVALVPVISPRLNTAGFHFFTIALIAGVVVALALCVQKRIGQTAEHTV